MEMDGKNIKKLIDEQTDKLEVPASLQPEAVVERLEEKAKKKRRSYYKKAAAFAACGVVVLGIGAVGMWNRLSPDDGETLYKTADKGEKTESGEITAGRINTAEDFDQIYGFIKAERDAQEKDAAAYGAELPQVHRPWRQTVRAVRDIRIRISGRMASEKVILRKQTESGCIF